MRTDRIALWYALPALLLLIAAGHALGQGRVQSKTLADIAILEDERAVDTVKVGQWIVSGDPEVRARTAYMIGIVGDISYRSYLSKLLDDDAKLVRLQAVFAAGQLGDSIYAQWLLRFSADGDSAIKSRAIEALSKVGSQATTRQLMAILRDTLESSHFRALAAESIHRLRDRLSFGALVAQATNPNVSIRERVFFSLSRRANREAFPLYVSALRDTNRQICLYALGALARVGDKSILAEIKPLLQENDWRLKYYSLGVVDKVRGRELLPDVAALLDAKEHVYVRQAAIRVLGDIGDQQASDPLTPFLDDADVNLCTEALTAIARLKKDEALPQIQTWSKSDNPRKRAAAATACGSVVSSERWSILGVLASDGAPTVRAAVYENLLSAQSDSIKNLFTIPALMDSDMVPAVLACDRIARDTLIMELNNLLTRYRGTRDNDIKAAILDCLFAFGDSLKGKPGVKEMVTEALADDNYSIRKRAAALASMLKIPVVPENDHYPTAITPESYRVIYASDSPNPIAEIKTVKGTIRIELLRNAAPKTVANFIKLAKSGFYDERVWHRVVPDFVIQDGCPRGDGWGGPGYEIRCEYNDLPYNTGSVGMATSGKDTGGSQYFICQSPQPQLNGRYTLFGRVLNGLDVVERIEIGDLIKSVKIIGPKGVALRSLVLFISTLLITGAAYAQTTPSAQDIIKAVIAKQERDRKHCEKYVNFATTNKIKYDKEMRPGEVTITKRKVYFWGERTSEEILSIVEDGKPLSPEEIQKKVVDLNEKWQDEQKDREKKEGSKDNSVDPLTLDGMLEYDYYQIGKGDSSFAVVPSTIATTGGTIDQSVEKLMSYYVVMARSKTLDSRHLNATYWIDAKTYGVLKTAFAPAKLPHFVDMLDFKMDYGVVTDNDSTLYLPMRFELKGKAGFLFFKGRFGVIEEYTSYRCDNAIADTLFNHRYFYSGGNK